MTSESRPMSLRAIRSKSDRVAEAVEKGLNLPWMGLRPDVVLHKGVPDASDQPTYVLDDPVRGVHFELGDAEAQLFLCLAAEQDLKSAVERLLRTTSLRPSTEDIVEFLKMLQKEKLAILPADAAIAAAERREEAREKEKGINLKKVINFRKYYFRKIFFFMIPLFRPDRFFSALYPWLSPLGSKPFQFLYGVLGIVGLIFTLEQIELYIHSASYLFSTRGAIAFAICIYVVKVFHEFGHAMVAKHYGLYIRRMGIFMMFFIPMLFTDTTDAWKLPSRRGRLFIGAAGVLVEFYIACVALFFWSVLPDGMWRSLMFYLSGASLVSTLFTNLNPLMRFDGYYVMMDYLRISNLRTRSMEMLTYYSRRILVDWRGEKPEEHPREGMMAIFGLFSKLYIVIIFVSIGFAIYHRFFELLGALLLLSGLLGTFILPALGELWDILKNWRLWGRWYRILRTVAIAGLMVAFLVVPLPRFEKLPALFLYEDVAEIKAPGPGLIAADLPEEGQRVTEGELLVRIRDHELEQRIKVLEYELAKNRAELKNLQGGGEEGAYRRWLRAEHERLTSSMARTWEFLAQLEIYAPMDGRVLTINDQIRSGAYVQRDAPILTVGDERTVQFRAYAREPVYRELSAQEIDGGKVFFKDIRAGTPMIRFREMLDFPVIEFPNESLFVSSGGPILGLHAPGKPVKAKRPYYPIIFDATGIPGFLHHGTPCFVRVDEKDRKSLFDRAKGKVIQTLASEGFL